MFEVDLTFPCLGAFAGIIGGNALVAVVAKITLGQTWDEAHDCQTQELLLQNSAPKNFIPRNTIKSILL